MSMHVYVDLIGDGATPVRDGYRVVARSWDQEATVAFFLVAGSKFDPGRTPVSRGFLWWEAAKSAAEEHARAIAMALNLADETSPLEPA